jgi:hypothetical protein
VRFVPVLLIAVALFACAGGSDDVSTRGSQGIRGTVLAGPQCPVETAGSPCPPEPASRVRVEIRRAGDLVAEAVTDPRGEFSADVDPGTYQLQAAPDQQGFVASKPVTVVVRDGAYTNVDVTVDTGIR